MRGLPFSACIGDVATFFRGLHSLDRERVYFAYDGTGRPSGEAYITFACADDFQTAMRLHKHKMGQRYIELFASSNADLQRVAKQRKLRLARGHGGPRVVVAPKDVAAASKTPPVSVQGQLSRGALYAPPLHTTHTRSPVRPACSMSSLSPFSFGLHTKACRACRHLECAEPVFLNGGRRGLGARPPPVPADHDTKLRGAVTALLVLLVPMSWLLLASCASPENGMWAPPAPFGTVRAVGAHAAPMCLRITLASLCSR